MGRSKLKISGYSSTDLLELIRKEKNEKIKTRLKAVYHVSEGKTVREVGNILLISFRRVSEYVKRFNDSGVDGLQDLPGRGNVSRLSKESKEKLKEILLKDAPKVYGFNSSTWTGAMVKAVIENEFNVTYKTAQIYNILRELGLSFQKGKGYYPEADEEKRKTFVAALQKKS